MKIEHVAIWTGNLEILKAFYQRYFGGMPNEKYTNENRVRELFSYISVGNKAGVNVDEGYTC